MTLAKRETSSGVEAKCSTSECGVGGWEGVTGSKHKKREEGGEGEQRRLLFFRAKGRIQLPTFGGGGERNRENAKGRRATPLASSTASRAPISATIRVVITTTPIVWTDRSKRHSDWSCHGGSSARTVTFCSVSALFSVTLFVFSFC
jgi:hypothetical protein